MTDAQIRLGWDNMVVADDITLQTLAICNWSIQYNGDISATAGHTNKPSSLVAFCRAVLVAISC